jgi:hypothetical protein
MDAIDNGFEDAVILGIELSKLDGFRPTTNEYRIKNKKQIEPIFYIRIPKNDYEIMMNFRTPSILSNSFRFVESSKKLISTFFVSKYAQLSPENMIDSYTIEVNSNFIVNDVVIGNNFRVFRDTLVAHGKLNPPYTDTREYKEIIKNSILYWKNGKWVKREELDIQ